MELQYFQQSSIIPLLKWVSLSEEFPLLLWLECEHSPNGEYERVLTCVGPWQQSHL